MLKLSFNQDGDLLREQCYPDGNTYAIYTITKNLTVTGLQTLMKVNLFIPECSKIFDATDIFNFKNY
jgi:hypothetical protein